ncbi:MAG: hypothetical protein M1821_004174 [Bathelium mastoideum]|nr:MAG: hypothetical protein M1821_004174 [Bathelium mastoideum]KAI9685436.1 MAG: hypothetical protein M1822_004567 [Bathelium mastoideum]
MGFSGLTGTLAIAFFNAAAAIGGILAGLLVDRFHVATVTAICGGGSAVAVLLVWGFAVSEPILYIFAILYGIFAGSFSTTWSGCANALRRRGRIVETGSVLSLMIAGKGIGAVVSGPLSSALIRAAPWRGKAIGAYGSSYGALVVFTGITSFFGAASFGGRLLGLV